MPAYATPADMMLRYDIRRISNLVSDSGNPVASGSLSSNTNLLGLIKDASNRVLMACRVANRYLQSDLDSIYDDSDRNSSLIRLVCDLTFGYLVSRRGLAINEVYAQAPLYKDAMDMLEQLRIGVRVFDDSPPDGTDAPTAGVEVDNVPSSAIQLASFWTNQTENRIFPFDT